MDKKETIDSQFEKIDFIFIGIKLSEKISTADLFLKYKADFDKMNLDVLELEGILNKMVEEGMLLKIAGGIYSVNPLNPELITLKHKFLEERESEKKDKMIDRSLKILPIAATIILGAITTIISIANLNLSKAKLKDAGQKITIKIDTNFNFKSGFPDTLLVLRQSK